MSDMAERLALHEFTENAYLNYSMYVIMDPNRLINPHHCWQKHLVTMKKWQYVNLYSTEPVKRVFTSLIIK